MQQSADPVRQASKPYDTLCALLRQAAVLGSVQTLLGWDQETMMPANAAALRADQLAAMSGIAHKAWTDPRIGEALAACESDKTVQADDAARVNVREARREYDRATKLPGDLVEELARTSSASMHAWKDARQKSDFSGFAPWLEKTVGLTRRKAECYGVPKPTLPGETTSLYDALLDEFEPHMTSWQVERVFTPLRAGLTPLIDAVNSSKKKPSDDVNQVRAPIDAQAKFNNLVAARVGYDYGGGRLDISTHPFSETIGPGDIRMTTRYHEDRCLDALFSTLHETGHSLYEQGLPRDTRFGQPLATSISLGVHESQSRMWENLVGRSLPFWKWCMPEAQKAFPGLERFSAEDTWRGVNIMRPSFIRVEADELTYNLHIMLRFDLERGLISGDLKVKDVPGAWNERMKKDLGLDVREDRLGCLQDIHWSMGAIGYFSTYSLGNCYAAQFWETIRKSLPDLDDQFAQGEFMPLLYWLRENIHRHGRRHTAQELCARITGKPLGHEALLRHLQSRVQAVYG